MAASWSEPMPGWWEARFSPAGEGTEVAFTTVMEPSGAMAVFTNLMRPWAARQLGRFMRDFRAWAERQPTSSIGRLGSTPAEARTTTAR
jgi:hypothetical protein